MNAAAKERTLGLGLDVGGTQTRWALADPAGEIAAEGTAVGLTALQLATPSGREQMLTVLSEIAATALSCGRPGMVYAGMTGLDDEREQIVPLIAAPLGLPAEAVVLKNDIELACTELFAPGAGIVVYAGTGTIAAYIDANNVLHRAGGRGALLDDAGGGYWIAHEALQYIWRVEDERPGSWRDSPMAVEMFARVGGTDWSHSRKFMYSRTRGDIGKLALAVAATADRDPKAMEILQRAGRELARLGDAMLARFGGKPIALTGRAFSLNPAIETSFRASLKGKAPVSMHIGKAHLTAARLAARSIDPQ